jgi:hypothetical protein
MQMYLQRLSYFRALALFPFLLGVMFVSPACAGEDVYSPGYWKNHLEAWSPTGYDPSDDFDATFGVDLFDPDITLEEALRARGGGVKKLARHGTAALLNAACPGGEFHLSEAQVIALVQAGDADALASFNELGNTVLGVTTSGIFRNYRYESSMGDWVTDTMRACDPTIDFALLTSGNLRADIDVGDITFGEVFDVLPFGNQLVIVELDGNEVRQVLEEGVTDTFGLVQVSGLSFTVDYDAGVGNHITGDVIDLSTGLPLVPTNTYYIAVSDFMAYGGAGNITLAANPQYPAGVVIRELVVNWIVANSPFTPPDPAVEQRIAVIGTPPT